ASGCAARCRARIDSHSMLALLSFRSIDSVIALVLRKQGVESPARFGEHATCLCDLFCTADVADLAGGHPHSAHLAEQRTGIVVRRAGHLLPRRTQLGAPFVDVGPPRVGQQEGPTAPDLFSAYEPFVLELRKRRVDRSRARAPDTVGTTLDLL